MNATTETQQACAVPLRGSGADLEVCLITSISKGRWGFPKGIIEADQTPREAALAEAWEEAGLHGQLDGPPLGSYEDRKWGQRLRVEGFLMWVSRADETWLEADVRQRCWVSPAEADEILAKPPQRELLRIALARIEANAT